jgi:hypothetical protein
MLGSTACWAVPELAAAAAAAAALAAFFAAAAAAALAAALPCSKERLVERSRTYVEQRQLSEHVSHINGSIIQMISMIIAWTAPCGCNGIINLLGPLEAQDPKGYTPHE